MLVFGIYSTFKLISVCVYACVFVHMFKRPYIIQQENGDNEEDKTLEYSKEIFFNRDLITTFISHYLGYHEFILFVEKLKQ